ncbi:hypothetical protein MKX07_004420 [Trichoderma sp. CBMAI-0711]|nr:hypothetical protein MKX07_004420 [Trichoderma sp. CBMAI-0711]
MHTQYYKLDYLSPHYCDFFDAVGRHAAEARIFQEGLSSVPSVKKEIRKDECQYETITLTSSSAGPSAGIKPISPLDDGLSYDRIRAAVVKRLSELKPSDVETAYSRNIRPWFPIVAEQKLVTQLPNSWDNKALDLTLLSLSIVLFSTAPNPKSCGDSNKFGIMDLYLSVKSWIALVEGLGMNSMELVQARLVIVAFEVFHGFYPAAYISIGAVVRAAETLKTGRDLEAPTYKPRTEEERVEELTTWAAIKILDRYIAAECGETPPVTRRIYNKDPDLPYSELPFAVCPVLLSAPLSPQRQFLRLYEATNLLDKVHLAFYEPTPRISFNLEEGALLLNFEKNTQMLKSLRAFLDRLNTRWLTAGRYVALLDEDTTPRIFKALERDRNCEIPIRMLGPQFKVLLLGSRIGVMIKRHRRFLGMIEKIIKEIVVFKMTVREEQLLADSVAFSTSSCDFKICCSHAKWTTTFSSPVLTMEDVTSKYLDAIIAASNSRNVALEADRL